MLLLRLLFSLWCNLFVVSRFMADLNARTGNNVTLSCSGELDTEYNAQWWFNFTLITDSTCYKNFVRPSTRYIMLQVSPECEGNIYCARQGTALTNDSVPRQLYAYPVIKNASVAVVKVKEGASVVLDCRLQISALNNIVVAWSAQRLSCPREWQTVLNNYSLVLDNINSSHSGTYTCAGSARHFTENKHLQYNPEYVQKETVTLLEVEEFPASVSSSTVSSSTSNPIPTPDRVDNQITSSAFVSSSTPAVSSSTSNPILPVMIAIISCAITLIAIFSTLTVVTCCLVLSKKRGNLSPPQDVVPVSANPAYEQVTLKSVVVQENSAYSIVHTVSPPAAAVAEYEYIGDWKHENDELTAANSPPQLDEVSLSPNPAYRQVNNIILQENSAYSIVHTVSPPAAATHYENIAVDDELTAANSPPAQDEVSVSPNPAYKQVTSIALQENSAYSIVCTVSPPAAATAEYENIAGLQHTQ